MLEHLCQRRRVLLDVHVLEFHLPPFEIVTGGCRVGSCVFAVDEHHPAILPGQTLVAIGRTGGHVEGSV
jgi:hypothetical protein